MFGKGAYPKLYQLWYDEELSPTRNNIEKKPEQLLLPGPHSPNEKNLFNQFFQSAHRNNFLNCTLVDFTLLVVVNILSSSHNANNIATVV